MANHDKIIREIMVNDVLACKPNDAIQQRLQNYMLVKSADTEVKKNSFFEIFSGILSPGNFTLKAGIIGALLACFVFFGNLNHHSSPTVLSDTCYVNTSNLLADTVSTSRDSIF